jgi:hypothetical protein
VGAACDDRPFIRPIVRTDATIADEDLPFAERPAEEDMPLSFNQEWMLTNHEIRPGQFTGSVFPAVFRLHGEVDRLALERALNTVIQRHAALRMTYRPSTRYSTGDRVMQLSFFSRTGLFVPGLYTQTLIPTARLHVRERECLSSEEVDRAIMDELSRPLDIGTAPQMRATLMGVDRGDHVLVLAMSHLAFDGWSMGLFTREFVSAYEAETSGAVRTLPAIQVHSPDFAVWQHRQFRAGGFEAEEAYWHDKWANLDGGGIRHRDIPFAVSAAPGMAVAQMRLALGAAESAAVVALLARLSATAYTFFRTVMTIVLHHYTGKRRVAFWANFANRRHHEFAQMIGWCANTHVVAVDVAPETTCSELCRDVATAVMGAQAHEALPLPALWQRLGRVLDTHDSRVNFDLLPKQRPRNERRLIEPVTSVAVRAADLDIRTQESGEGFDLVATFNSHRYGTEGVGAMLASMRRVAARFVEAPGSRVSDCVAAHGQLTS